MFDFWGPVLVEDSWCGEEFSVFSLLLLLFSGVVS